MWQVDRKFIYILFYFSSLAASEENWKIGGLETPPLLWIISIEKVMFADPASTLVAEKISGARVIHAW